MRPERENHIAALDGLRGLAAVLVVLHHIPVWHPLLEIPILRNGYLMVDFFFTLSGFVIASTYGSRLQQPGDLLRFQWLRLGRLYPVHFVFLLLFVGIEVLRFIANNHMGVSNIRVPAFTHNNFEALVQQLFLIQAIGPLGNAVTFNAPAWSISVEFYTYLIFGLLVLLLRQRTTFIFGLIAGFSIFALAIQTTFGFENMLRCTSGFFFGALAANLRTAFAHLHLPRGFTSALGALLVIFLAASDSQYASWIYIISGALIFCVSHDEKSLLSRSLKMSLPAYLGKVSYSIYMSHAFAIWLVVVVLKYFLKRPESMPSSGSWLLILSTKDTLLAIAATFLLTLILSSLTYHWIEKPMRKRSRKLIGAS